VASVEAVGLERDDGLTGSRGECASAIRSDDHVAVVEGEIDKLHGRQRPSRIDDAADGHGG
jgi:hypothetical protein